MGPTHGVTPPISRWTFIFFEDIKSINERVEESKKKKENSVGWAGEKSTDESINERVEERKIVYFST